MGLITENNSSYRNMSQSKLTNKGLSVYKKMTHKRQSTVVKMSINQLRKQKIPVITYVFLKLYSFEVKRCFKDFTRLVFVPPNIV